MSTAVADENLAPPSVVKSGPVGNRAAGGALWTLGLSVFGKLIAFASQIALAKLLLPHEFGLAAMALSVASFTSFFSSTSIRNVLIQRTSTFETDAPQAFWLALLLHAAGGLLLIAIAKPASAILGEPGIVPLIVILAAAAPLQALPTVYSAKLYRELQFRRAALVILGASLVQNTVAVVMASTGTGAYALVTPILATACYLAVAFRMAAGGIRIGRPNLRAGRVLAGPVFWLMANALFTALQAYGANFLIGLNHDSTVTGLFFWGYTVSSQAVYLLAANLQQVLVPVLAKLTAEVDRQYEAAVRTCRTMLAVIALVGVLQWLLAGPVIALLFHDQWSGAVSVVKSLSAAMITQPFGVVALSLFVANGRYKRLAFTTALMAAGTLLGAAIGAHLGTQREIAIAVAVGVASTNVVAGWLAFREFGRGFKDLIGIAAAPAALILPTFLAGQLALAWCHRPDRIETVVLTTALCGTTYFALAAKLLPEIRRDLLARVFPKSGQIPPDRNEADKELLR